MRASPATGESSWQVPPAARGGSRRRAFVAAIAGAIVSGLLINAAARGGAAIPGCHGTDVATVLYAVPGALLAMALIYLYGAARERATEQRA